LIFLLPWFPPKRFLEVHSWYGISVSVLEMPTYVFPKPPMRYVFMIYHSPVCPTRSRLSAGVDHHHKLVNQVMLCKARSKCCPLAQRPGKQHLFRRCSLHEYRNAVPYEYRTDDRRTSLERKSKTPFTAAPEKNQNWFTLGNGEPSEEGRSGIRDRSRIIKPSLVDS
jgi:hypothetical protein